MRTRGNLLQIRAANPASMDPYQQFSGANLRDRHGFKAHVVHAAIHGGLHRTGNALLLVFDRVLSGDGHQLLDEASLLFASLQITSYFPVLGSALLKLTSTVMESRYGESSGLK